jgi:hypothetical protein
MPNRQNYNFLADVAIEGNIRPAAEFDHTFAELGGQIC